MSGDLAQSRLKSIRLSNTAQQSDSATYVPNVQIGLAYEKFLQGLNNTVRHHLPIFKDVSRTSDGKLNLLGAS